MARRTVPFRTGVGGTGDPQTTARSIANEAAVDKITRPAGASVPAGEVTLNSGKIWLNDTAAAITVPATDSAANMAGAGFTEQTQTQVDKEVVLSTVDLSGAADPAAKIGRNINNGKEYEVKAGLWSEIVRSEFDPATLAPTVDPKMDAAIAVKGASVQFAPEDHAHPRDAAKVNIADDAKVIRASGTAVDSKWTTEKAVRDALDVMVVTGDYVGSDTTFAALPTASTGGKTAVNGDWATLTVDVIGTGTAEAPEFPKGIYLYDGAAYVFAFALGSDYGDATLAELLAGTETANFNFAPKTIADYVTQAIATAGLSFAAVRTFAGSGSNLTQLQLQTIYDSYVGDDGPNTVPPEVTIAAAAIGAGYKLYLGHDIWWFSTDGAVWSKVPTDKSAFSAPTVKIYTFR